MADSELVNLTADTSPSATDIFYGTDSGGTVDKKFNFGDTATYVASTLTGEMVSLVPAGENVDDNVQDAIDTLFTRSAPTTLFDDLRIASQFLDDFRAPNTLATRLGEQMWLGAVVGTGAFAPGGALDNSIISLQGTAVNDAAKITGYMPLIGGPVWSQRWYARGSAATAAHQWTANFGQMEDDATPHGAWFRINNVAAADPLLICVTSAGSTEETTTTGFTVADLVYNEYGIESDGTGVYRFYVNGSLVATHSTIVPGAALMNPSARFLKSVGSGTLRNFDIDYMAMRLELNR